LKVTEGTGVVVGAGEGAQVKGVGTGIGLEVGVGEGAHVKGVGIEVGLKVTVGCRVIVGTGEGAPVA